MRWPYPFLLLGCAMAQSGSLTDETAGFSRPANFPAPHLPEDNPISPAGVALGERLFSDNALSVTGTVSCAFCHMPEEAFSDPARQPWGVRPGRTTRRHSMPLFNLAWKPGPFRWDGDAKTMREQILRPIADPIELGENPETLPGKLALIEGYPDLFTKAFGTPEITMQRLAMAIEQYLLTLVSSDSRYDQSLRGEVTLTEKEQRGLELFSTPVDTGNGQKGAGCFQCHPAPLFTDHQFHNNGLHPSRDRDAGLAYVSGDSADRGKFATPSLRNIEITAPYMHDGRFATLQDVVNHYNRPLGHSDHPDPLFERKGIRLSEDDQNALIAFLKSLTDPRYLETEENSEEVDPFDLPAYP